MGKIGVIYKVTNTVNSKIYIGQTTEFNRRKINHISDSFNKKKTDYDIIVFHKAIRKYGLENFKWDILWEGDNQFLNEKESYFIKKFNSYKNGEEVFAVIQAYMVKNYNLNAGNLSRLCKGYLTNYKNWYLDKNKIKKDKLFTFVNEDGLFEYNVTINYMVKKYKLNKIKLKRVCNDNLNNHLKWSINFYKKNKRNRNKKFTQDGQIILTDHHNTES